MTQEKDKKTTDPRDHSVKTLHLKDSGGIQKSRSIMAQVLKEKRDQPKQSNERTLSLLKTLETLYPKLFDRNDPKPLKLKIHQDILADLKDKQGITPSYLRNVLRFYTSGSKYLLRIIQLNARYDLSGNEAGSVLEEHKQDAKKTLEKRKGKKQKN